MGENNGISKQLEYDEARFIVSEIERSARKYNDYAVLYRMNSQSRVIEDVDAGRHTYRVLGGLRFYDRKEIKDAVAYLRLIFNRGDNISLKRIINEPKRGIGKTTLEKTEELAGTYGLSLYEICKNARRYPELARAADRLEGFANLIEDLSKTEQSPLDEFLSNVLTETGYIPELEREGSTESRWRLDNLYELIASAKEYEQANDEPSLGGFLENIALVSDVDNYDETQDTVVLMTLHSAKGLEFPVVFIAGAEEGCSELSLNRKQRGIGGGAPALLCGHNPGKGNALHNTCRHQNAVRRHDSQQGFALCRRAARGFDGI